MSNHWNISGVPHKGWVYETIIDLKEDGEDYETCMMCGQENIRYVHLLSHEMLDNMDLIEQLIDQVYQFIRMYWKSTNQQNLPVTIKYPEMVAEIYPYFEHEKLADYGKESLWFL